MLTLATLLRDLGLLLYGGPLVAFTILIVLAERLPKLDPWHVVRVYRAWGAGLGLSLGVSIFGLLWRHYILHGAFTWDAASPAHAWGLAAELVYLAMWISNIKLEIWTLEPLRRLDSGEGSGAVPDPPAYAEATRKLAAHMRVHSLFVLGYVVVQQIADGLAGR